MASRPPMAAPRPPAPGGATMPAPAAPQQQMGPDTGGMEQATPEEQAMYEQLVTAALDFFVPKSSDQIAPPVLASLKGQYPEAAMQMFAEAEPPIDTNPLDAVAVTATIALMMAENEIEKGGAQIPNDIVFHAGAEVIEYAIAASEAANIHDFNEQDMERVTYRAMDLYRTASPRADQEALAAEFEEVVAADRAGQLGALLPGIEGRGKRMEEGEQEEPGEAEEPNS